VSIPPPGNSPIAAGYRLDRYELLCPIAEGGMASVWIARQTGKHGFQKLVAIKTILPKYAEDPAFQTMFIDEARIASRIEHANVTQILDVGEQHDVTYLVMEYVDGDALSKIARAAKKKEVALPLGILLRVMADVCGGLHAAHELKDDAGVLLGVVHRDVSPQNILITTRGVAKLIDFGIAKASGRLAGDTNVDQLKGKVQYMPPEQALGKPVDRRADVWAVGAVLYHLIVGKPPFEAANEIQTLFAVTSGRSPVPLPPHIPAPIREVVKKALAFAPDDRYATAAALQHALEEAINITRLGTSTSVVAAFLGEIVGDRADKRKEAIALGLKAASERERVAGEMRSNAETTNVTSDTGARLVSLTQLEPTTSATGQTLGSSAMSVPLFNRRRRLTVSIAAFFATLVLAVGIAVLWGRTSKHVAAAALSPPPAASSVVSTRAAAAAPTASAAAPPSTAPAAAASPWGTVPAPSGVPPVASDEPEPAVSAAAVTAPAEHATVTHHSHAASTAASTATTAAKPATTAKQRENYGF
jgi:serine/threonine protein kinase